VKFDGGTLDRPDIVRNTNSNGEVSVTVVEGHSLSEAELAEFLGENLAKFAVPRYIKIVEDFPKTETQRIRKKELEKAGVMPGTWDAQEKRRVAESLVS